MLVKRKEEFDYRRDYAAVETAAPARANSPKKLRLRCVALLVLFAAMAMFVTARSEKIVSDGYALVQMKLQTEKLVKDNEMLKLEIARLKSPQRIKEVAINQLGMIVPQDVYFASKSGTALH